ncbi:class I SAM-dependent methyltransferase [Mesorhizobium sp.]|uniref:class I SAM-dependent methyltransferase n=1 Tax=Mesorhizobium sp. TaxID=1871066 RepID=UPI000FE6683C|nr:class I SAM-dependent methyltransferase [Mesorhizobium sp.]RWM39495.1 MAG: class I SAM-dependent methyltransferase [Mesorhizobium sp.]TJV52549.1 MAG: class I SAM-dependent methyltransferase [Mesorhizobium sp.]
MMVAFGLHRKVASSAFAKSESRLRAVRALGTSVMTICPACGSKSTVKLFEVTADEASRHFINPRQDPERSRKLTSHLSDLWGSDACDIRKCSDCGFGFADPFVAGGVEFYNLAWAHPSYPTMRWEYARTIVELTGLKTKGKTVVDVGAGFGYFLDRVKGKFFEISDISAVDYNEESQSVLSSKGFKTFSNDVRAGSFDSMREAFDFICLFQVFEHMDHVDDVFARLKFLLRPRGSVFIAVPNDNRTYYMESHGSLIDMPPNHIGRWTKGAFAAMCRRHDLQLTKCEREPFNLLGFLKQDIVNSYLRKGEKPGTLSEFVRALPRSRAQRIAQGLTALAISPSRLPAWAYAVKNASTLGGNALWARIDKVSSPAPRLH